MMKRRHIRKGEGFFTATLVESIHATDGKGKHNSTRIALLIAAATFVLFLPALMNGFVNWDDPHYIYNNSRIRTLGPEFFRWALFDASTVYWHPLTWISHALDYAMWGLNPLGHHLTSIVIHAVNTFIVVRLSIVLLQFSHRFGEPLQTGRRPVMIGAGIAGVLFGVHPVHVESVAWAAERKDLLYSMCYLLSILSYAGYAVRNVGVRDSRNWFRDRGYLTALFLFFLSLCSKPMAVTLPAVLLLLDWYPFGRLADRKRVAGLVLEKVPFLVLSGIVSVVTIIAQKQVGAVATLEAAPFSARVMVACKGLVLYLWNMLVPVGLLPLYPYPKQVGILMPEYLLALMLVVLITAGCLVAAGRQPYLLAVWGYFVVSILPVLGLIQSGPQAMADRFAYLPSLGPFLLIGAGGGWLWGRVSEKRPVRSGVVAIAALLTIALAGLTLQQIRVWHDGLTLWTRTIDGVRDRFPEPYYLRGITYGDLGTYENAIRDYTMAITIEPAYGPAYINRGVAFLETGKLDQAIEDLNEAIRLRANPPDSYTNRGNVWYKKGELERAIEDYTMAISLDPALYQTYLNRGNVYKVTGDVTHAFADYSRALSLNPEFSKGYLARGDLYLKSGSVEDAVRDYQKACSLGSEVGCSKALFPIPGFVTAPAKQGRQ